MRGRCKRGEEENCVAKLGCWRAGESSTGCAGDAKRKPAPGIRRIQSNSHRLAGGLEGVKRLFYWQVKALFLSEGRRKSPGAGDSVWGLTGALEGGGMTR